MLGEPTVSVCVPVSRIGVARIWGIVIAIDDTGCRFLEGIIEASFRLKTFDQLDGRTPEDVLENSTLLIYIAPKLVSEVYEKPGDASKESIRVHRE